MKTAMNGDAITCECYHLAHFGVLFVSELGIKVTHSYNIDLIISQDLSPRVIPDDFVLALSVFSYVGLVTSLLCLTLFLLIYISVR